VCAANSERDGWTKPSVNHPGTGVARKATSASAHQPQRERRCRASAASLAGGAAASSARTIPAANHDAKAGGRSWSLRLSGSPSAYHGTSAHPRLSAPTAAITGIHHLAARSEEHTSELQSRFDLVCRLLLAKNK